MRYYHLLKSIVFGFLIIILFSHCTSDNKKVPVKQEPKPEVKIVVPKFDRDSAFSFIEKQVNFGPRVPNTEGHKACKEWLVSKMESYGAEVIQQDFKADAYTGVTLNGTNIIAQFNPKNPKRLLLAAHWDTRHIADSKLSTSKKDEPIMGADDGGSGVGVLLEIARQLQSNPIDLGIDIIFFDAEDHGEPSELAITVEQQQNSGRTWCLGAQYWSANIHRSGYKPKHAILLDMVGARNAKFAKEGISMQVKPLLVNKIWKLGQSMGYADYFIDDVIPGLTDDHYFVTTVANIPMIDIIYASQKGEQSFGDHWHTHNDNLDIIDKRTLRAVGQVMLAVIYKEAGGKF